MWSEKRYSDYVLLKKCILPSEELLIIFCPIRTPPGKFMGTNIFNKTPRHMLFLNSDNDWYINGIKGLGTTIDGTVDGIRNVIANEFSKIKTIVVYGGSMGGYGAILYGALLNANYCVAFGTEIILDIYLGLSSGFVKGRKLNLKPIVKASNSQIRLFYGEHFVTDMLGACIIDELPNVHVQTFKYKSHILPPYFQAKYGLETFINQYFSAKEFVLDKDDAGHSMKFPKIIKLRYACAVAASKGLHRAVDNTVLALEEKLCFCDSISVKCSAYYNISLAYQKIAEYEKALMYSKKAISAERADAILLENVAQCLKLNKDKTDLDRYITLSIDAHIPKIFHDPVKAYVMLFDEILLNVRENKEHIVDALNILLSFKGNVLHPFILGKLNSFIARQGPLIDDELIGKLKIENAIYLCDLCDCLIKNNLIKGVIPLLEKAIGRVPKNARPHYQLSIVFARMGDMDKAIDQIELAIQLNKNNADYYQHLGNILIKKSDLMGAKMAFERAVELAPGLADSHYKLCIIFARMEEVDKAIDQIKLAIKLKNDNAYYYHQLGSMLMRKNDFQASVIAFEKATELAPNLAGSLYQQSVVLSGMKQIDKAIEQIKLAIDLKNNNAHYYYHLGKMLERKGDLKEAEIVYNKSIELAPNLDGPHYQLSIMFEKLDNINKAIDQIKLALDLNKDNTYYYKQLGRLMRKNGDLGGAV